MNEALLIDLLNRRPAMNAGLIEAYAHWNDEVYRTMSMLLVTGVPVATWVPLPGTLPEPGKPVLLDIGMEYPIRAMWAAKHTLEVGMEDDSGFGEYDEATDTYYCPEGWYEWNEHEETHWAVDKTPMAWCELPSNGGASHRQAPAQAEPAAVAGPSEAVAYLDIGAGGYLDLGTDLSNEALSRLPKGRHALVIAGTYGIDGYTAAPNTQPAPDEILNMAREQGLPETETEGVFRVNVDDLGRMFAADRAARAPADSVTALAGAGVAHALSDGQIEAMPVWRNFVGLWPESRREIVDAVVDLLTTPSAQAADSVLEDAARYRWLRQEHERVDPVCHLTWKRNLQRDSAEWVNTAVLDTAIDAAMAAQGGK